MSYHNRNILPKSVSLLLLIWLLGSCADNKYSAIRTGNELFYRTLKDTVRNDTSKFVDYHKAGLEYAKALAIDKDDTNALFNLGDAMLKQFNMDSAISLWNSSFSSDQSAERQGAVKYNIGTAELVQHLMLRQQLNQLQQGGMAGSYGESEQKQIQQMQETASKLLDKSTETLKESLRKYPFNLNAKYNLAYALKLKEENPNGDGGGNDDQNRQQDQNQDQNQQGNDENQEDGNNKQDQQQGQQDENQQDQQQQGQSRKRAADILKAVKNKEKETQGKVKAYELKQEENKKKQKSNGKNW